MIEQNFIAGALSCAGTDRLQSTNPATKQQLPGEFSAATEAEIDRACTAAEGAWRTFRSTSGSERAALLRTIADNIEGLGDELVERAMAETGLPQGRIVGERGRTCGQLRLFAQLAEEGSWVDAVIDPARPERQPNPRVDIRRMNRAIGPVAIFGASNFPLAFSTAGGDTASALAAGCPVVVKGHPSHAGTHALIAGAIAGAVEVSGLPAAVFSAVHGGKAAGQFLVAHPAIRAVGFTGSEAGGTALMRAAANRPVPIPVYAEMGSVNPVFLLPGKVADDVVGLAATLAGSVNLGAGQFCTNPGVLVLGPTAEKDRFLDELTRAFAGLSAATMLNEGINQNYETLRQEFTAHPDIDTAYAASSDGSWSGQPTLVTTSATKFASNPDLQREVFGPLSLLVVCDTGDDLLTVANSLHGQLTCTIMGNAADLAGAAPLAAALGERAGRLIYNGVPTGVEVGHAMHHGGLFPAASSPKYTSVGTGAIQRFARPLCFQNAPQELLPEALKDGNPLGIWRRVDGEVRKG